MISFYSRFFLSRLKLKENYISNISLRKFSSLNDAAKKTNVTNETNTLMSDEKMRFLDSDSELKDDEIVYIEYDEDKFPLDEFGRSYGTGRRKTSVARVWLSEGSGQFIVNNKPFSDYFQPMQRMDILKPFLITETAGLFDVYCTVKGGGMSGQAGAIRLGISKALEIQEPGMRPLLKRFELLTRDDRRVERKKPGQKKARKKFQWVKR